MSGNCVNIYSLLGIIGILALLTLLIASFIFNIFSYKRLTQGKTLKFLQLVNKPELVNDEKDCNSNKPLITFLILLCLMLFMALIAVCSAM